ncbi:ATP phosphoribosyltransferase regulatory subunit [Anaerotruncus colihominis]|uniref:ATP phosphoribosyltransferase regulatory subunit n=1 Tax=Anaerotruncus colihominis TaxID=169435 RepID=A0A845SSI4_9FIRM|nr:ATP phosphoribosyltransferase regulatory subunit [Anaerotruncus colihominis]MCR2025744.1 ATP phosphoribosyltransferase regulatory subunit [Anaerotruncus colihominis]NBI77763.1 ATP phosphoribosyltransferase regulatory subunit [Anaerotruncus colihominis]NDO38705.1 ATP phosphoribosyltransferase regulatory subunit [Anaerotruncus colihominis]
MRYYDKVTPDGTRDLLFDECVLRGEAVGRLTAMFRARGYRQVITPAIEFYDVFGSSAAHFPQENMYKLTDTRGRLMVIRPDCTIPIARLVATRLAASPMPLRLYYSENVYRVEHDLRGKRNEVFQTGVELIGSNALRSDLEIVELAASGLSDIGGERFRIELCHVGYFKALIDSLDAPDEIKEQIRLCIEQKNYSALGDLLEPFGTARAAQALRYLPRLFGGEEVFEKAYALFDENGAKESLDYLRSIYDYLRQLGLEGSVIVDLGLVNQIEYYTGIIFRGYFDGIGEPVLSGGRYDNLISDFGAALPAVGFAVNADLAAAVIEKQPPQTPDILVFSDEAHLPQAVNYIRSLTDNGLVVESSMFDDYDASADYARRRGIRQLHVVDDDIETVDLFKTQREGRE